MRTILVLATSLALLAPLAFAEPAAPSEARPVIGTLPSSIDAVNYAHPDCVGPGLPGTAPAHGAHTTRVTGFVIDPARPVSFGVIGLALFGAGVCPVTAAPGPILPQDMTGRWTLTAVCRGTQNEGATFFTWRVDFVGGIATSQSYTPGTCIGFLNSSFALDVTIAISSTALLGVQLGPAGGVQHTIQQA